MFNASHPAPQRATTYSKHFVARPKLKRATLFLNLEKYPQLENGLLNCKTSRGQAAAHTPVLPYLVVHRARVVDRGGVDES